MAELKLSTVWKIEKFVDDMSADMRLHPPAFEFVELEHPSLPRLRWTADFSGEEYGRKGFADIQLNALFGTGFHDPQYAWASFQATLLGENGEYLVACERGPREFMKHGSPAMTLYYVEEPGCFKNEDVNNAIRKDGSLNVRIDLTILKVGEMLKCRELLRGLLANKTLTDVDVKVGQESFQLHKSVLAETSTVFAAMLDDGKEEAKNGVLLLPDTNAAVFQAFTQAIYFDSWDFLSNADLTEDVLILAAKYKVGSLQDYCDDSLAEKVNDHNALKILTKSAALCNAEKTKAACIAVLAEQPDFIEEETWLDFKKRNRIVALEMLDVLNDKLVARVSCLKRERDAAQRESNSWKRMYEALKEKASSSKRTRK